MQISQFDNSYLIISELNLEKINKYILQLQKWNGLDLIAKSTQNDIWNWHIIESLSIINFFSFSQNIQIVDFGAGGGVIGIPLSYVLPNNVLFVERNKGKQFFLEQIMLKKTCTLDQIDENVILVVRGVDKIKNVLDLCCAKYVIFFKSNSTEIEINEALKKYTFNYQVFKRKGLAFGNIVILTNCTKRRVK